MANYFLKNTNATKMYRIEYTQGIGPGDVTTYVIDGTYVTGQSIVLPNGNMVSGIDVEIDPKPVLTDHILAQVTPGTQAEYRTLAKSIIDTRW